MAKQLKNEEVRAAQGQAAVAALNGPQDVVEDMRAAYEARRDFMVEALNEIEGISCSPAEGAIYLLPRFTKTKTNSLQLANELLERSGIAATPGIAFGTSAEGHLRFSIATAMDELERAKKRRPLYLQ